MKKSILFLVLLQSLLIFAQAPQKMTYQSVVRNSTNALLTNQAVGVRISIVEGTADGSPVYSETHAVTTNANGLFTLEVGGGNNQSSTFAEIAWSNGSHFIKSEIDPAGGTNYTLSATKELLSVPYALNAANGVTTAQADAINAQEATNTSQAATNITIQAQIDAQATIIATQAAIIAAQATTNTVQADAINAQEATNTSQAATNTTIQAQIDAQATIIATQAAIIAAQATTNTVQADAIAGQAAAIAAIYAQIHPNVYHYGYTGNGFGMFAFNGAGWSTISTNTPANFYANNYIGQIANKSYWKIYNSATETQQLFSFDGTTWDVPSTSAIPEGMYGSYTYIGVINNKIYHKTTTYINNDWDHPITTLYSFDGFTWSALFTSVPEGINGSGTYIGAINNKIYHKTTTYINNDWDHPINTLYSFDGTTWSTLSTNLPEGIYGTGTYIGAINNRMYHYTTTYINNDWNNPITTLYSFDGTTWNTISTNTPPYLSMERTYIGVLNNKIYHNTYTWDPITQNQIYTMYSFNGSTWSAEAGVNAPAANSHFGGWLSNGPMMEGSLILY
jgi:hypothetical protein